MTLLRRLTVWRWCLLAGMALAVVATPPLLGIALPSGPLLGVLALLAAYNSLIVPRRSAEAPLPSGLAGQLLIDLTGLGVLLYLSGGAANPLVSLLLFPVAVAALSLPGRWVILVTLLAVAIYSVLTFFFLPLNIADVERASRLHLAGMWLTFVVSALMTAWFITHMTISIRTRDAELAAVREQALRDGQIVALGQQAAGAAHELGTPLATMIIVADELAKDPRIPADLREDTYLLRKQIMLCKEIISNLVKRAGIDRTTAIRRQTTVEWMGKLLAKWRSLWPNANCALLVETKGTSPMIGAEDTLEQAIFNLLNNAVRVSPHAMTLSISWDAEQLSIAMLDRGPGFPAEVLRLAGSEPLSGSEQGSGIGLWLTRSAVERLGGTLHLENRPEGGAAELRLPVSPHQRES